MNNTKIIAAAFAATLAAAPAFAQTTTGAIGNPSSGMPAGSTAPGNVGAGSSGMGGSGMTTPRAASNSPTDRNPVLTATGDVRASKVIGSSVYNENKEKIGSIDDIILGKDNKPAQVVVSVGGWLGMGAKLVAVPYDKLQFGNTRESSDNRVMMPGATKQSVGAMADFHYVANG